MSTKQQLMEDYFQRYGVASSMYELAGKLKKRFPNKSTSFLDEARDFIINRINQHRTKEREEYHYHVPQIRHVWNPKYIKHGTIRDFIRWMAEDHSFNKIQQEFTEAFRGLKYQPAFK